MQRPIVVYERVRLGIGIGIRFGERVCVDRLGVDIRIGGVGTVNRRAAR